MRNSSSRPMAACGIVLLISAAVFFLGCENTHSSDRPPTPASQPAGGDKAATNSNSGADKPSPDKRAPQPDKPSAKPTSRPTKPPQADRDSGKNDAAGKDGTDAANIKKPLLPESIVEVLQLIDPAQPKRVVEVTSPQNRITLTTENVRRLRIRRDSLRNMHIHKSIAVFVDTQGIEWRADSDVLELELSSTGAWQIVPSK